MARKARGRRTPTATKVDDRTTAYARDVVSGKIVAGEFVRGAAERHLLDLKEGPKRGLVWIPEKAERAINFFPAVLTVTAGAHEGLPFELLPWHVFVVGSLFGWHKKQSQEGPLAARLKIPEMRLRFRLAWLETGKGQAKSPLMAAIGIYLLGFFGIPRAEIYAIAWDKDQANVLFKDAVAMCRATMPGFDEGESLEAEGDVVIRGTLDNAWKIEHPASGSKFQSLANGENINGPRPTAVLADEIHEFKNGHPIETWKQAVAKMPGDAMMILGTNTPATTQITATDYSDTYQKIAKGEYQDDEAFVFIARVDKKDDPFNDEACWIKSLPALGLTFPIDNIRGQVATAKNMLSTALSLKRLYFGIPVGSVEFWIAEEAWLAVQGEVDEVALRGLPCWLSLDLSSKNDLTALTATWFDDDGHCWTKTWYWTRTGGLKERAIADKAPYLEWVDKKFLTAVPGNVIEKSFVAAQVQQICREHQVQLLAADIAGIEDFTKACDEIDFQVWRFKGPDEPEGRGLMIMPHAQGTRVLFEEKQLCMPRSIERFEDLILNKAITIEASPVTYSCAANAMVITDAQKNRAFDKKNSRGRIDGIVTNAMSVGAATSNFRAPTKPQLFSI